MESIWSPVPPRFGTLKDLSKTLETLEKKYSASKGKDRDPISMVYSYSQGPDQEVVAFFSALFAFGNVVSILGFLRKFLPFLSLRPQAFLLSDEEVILPKDLSYRWIQKQDLLEIVHIVRRVLQENGSLEESYKMSRGRRTHKDGMIEWMKHFKSKSSFQQSRGLKFFFSSPETRSTAKRLNLFFRWVVRPSFPDLGLWSSSTLPAHELFMPIDTHLGRILQYIGVAKRRSIDWSFVEEATEFFRGIRPEDPCFGDFAMAQMGILKHCQHSYIPEICSVCQLNAFCSKIRWKAGA